MNNNEFGSGVAEGTSLITRLNISEQLGYSIYAAITAREKLYLYVYGLGNPPNGFPYFARHCIYQDIKNGGLYVNAGDESSSIWFIVTTSLFTPVGNLLTEDGLPIFLENGEDIEI